MTELAKSNHLIKKNFVLSTLTRRTFITATTTILAGMRYEYDKYWHNHIKNGLMFMKPARLTIKPYCEPPMKLKKTDGGVTINTYPASSLGKETELNESLDFGVNIEKMPTFQGS